MKLKKQTKNRILPEGYYTIDGLQVRLQMGPYAGVVVSFGKIKFRQDNLTGMPTMLYHLTIEDSACFDPSLLESDPKLSRIIGAVIVDEFSQDLNDGGTFESVECPHQDLKL
jgi:hypothetical protein